MTPEHIANARRSAATQASQHLSDALAIATLLAGDDPELGAVVDEMRALKARFIVATAKEY